MELPASRSALTMLSSSSSRMTTVYRWPPPHNSQNLHNLVIWLSRYIENNCWNCLWYSSSSSQTVLDVMKFGVRVLGICYVVKTICCPLFFWFRSHLHFKILMLKQQQHAHACTHALNTKFVLAAIDFSCLFWWMDFSTFAAHTQQQLVHSEKKIII